MTTRQVSWLILGGGVLLIVGPPLFIEDLQRIFPVLLLAVLMILVGIGRLIRVRFFAGGQDAPEQSLIPARIPSSVATPSGAIWPMNPVRGDAEQEKPHLRRHLYATASATNSGTSAASPRPTHHTPGETQGEAAHQGVHFTTSNRKDVGHAPRLLNHLILSGFSAAEPARDGHSKLRDLRGKVTASPQSNPANESNQAYVLAPEDNIKSGLFDMDPEVLKAQLAVRLRSSLLELFDIDPDHVKAALAAMLEAQLQELFDIDPESIKAAIAELMEKRLLELFDIDPIVVHQALATRSETQLAALFDAEPDVIKAAIVAMVETRIAGLFDLDPQEVKKILAARREAWEVALFDVDPQTVRQALVSMVEVVLFDIDPDLVRKALTSLAEEELVELFDADPELVKAALKLRYSNDVLDLFDQDPATLRATFAWRQTDNLSELYDTDPEALRALWEGQKAETADAGEVMLRQETLKAISQDQVPEILAEQQTLLEALSQPSLRILGQQSRTRKARIARDHEDIRARVSLEYLRRQVAARIVEDRVLSLEIQRTALQGVLSESRLNEAQKAILLGEVSRRLTSARTLSLQLRQEARQQLFRDRLADQEATFKATRKPSRDLDDAARERMRQRMLSKK